MSEGTLRDLTALQTYSFEEFELAKNAFAKNVDQCVAYEEKLRELDNAILDLTKNKLLYKEDRRVDRIINRLQCTRNFLYKQVSRFTNFETVLKEKRDLLEKKRTENLKLLNKAKMVRVKNREDFDKSQHAMVPSSLIHKKKLGRPKKGDKDVR